VPVQPVVKGDAYGHGVLPVARALEAAGADGFGVATMDEALVLRDGGIDRPILVLYPIPAAYAEEARARGIAVTAGDRELLDALRAGVTATGDQPPLDVHLELETGLGRGGFTAREALDAARSVATTPGLRLAGAWTHLQAPEDDTRSRGQFEAFTTITRGLATAGIELGPRHLAASGSLLLGEDVALDGVRPGLATYGLVPDELLARAPARDAGLRPILSLRARPVRVAELPPGTGISYGPTFTTSRPSRIATLPLGYGDGWSRALSNRATALVRGFRVPLVGNVAMDAVMADVTDVAGPPVSVADEFVLIGTQGSERITVADVAAARGTNSWEVVTNLAARLPRVYHAASVPQETRTLVSTGVGGRRSTRA
jgi:alanine racemase